MAKPPREAPETKNDKPSPSNPDWTRGMVFQGWVSVAAWMTVGLLLEGLIAYRAPAYLNDPQRRELFRLAHAHGALLGVLLLAAAWCGERFGAPPRVGQLAMRAGAVLMPLGFFLGGAWHPEGDPGWAIWLAPPGALLVLFGAVTMALAVRAR